MIELHDDDSRDFEIDTEIVGKDGGRYWMELKGTEYGNGDEEWTAEITDDADFELKLTDLDPWPDFLPRLNMQPLKKHGIWSLGDST